MPTVLFKKGQSGNPGGRPKRAQFAPGEIMGKQQITALARSHAPEAIQTLVACLKDPRHKVVAAQALLERAYGKPPQEITGDNDRPLAIAFSWAPAQMPAAAVDTAPVIDATSDQLKVVWDRAANGDE